MLYTDEVLIKAKKRILISSILISCFALVLILVNIFSFICINKENRMTIQLTISIVDVLLVFVIIYLISNYLVKFILFRSHTKFMISSESVKKTGVLEEISEQSLTLKRGITCKALVFDIDGDKKQFYINESFDISNLVIGDSYTFGIVSTFIKELNHEN